jgi:hypothetical protein
MARYLGYLLSLAAAFFVGTALAVVRDATVSGSQDLNLGLLSQRLGFVTVWSPPAGRALETNMSIASPAASAEVDELQKALARERERSQAVAAENAAITEKLASLQSTRLLSTQRSGAATKASTEPTAQGAPAASGFITGTIGPTPVAPVDSPLIQRAEALFRSGDVSGARLLLERASQTNDDRALFLLAQTFDPRILSERGVVGIRGDAKKAEELYDRAQRLSSKGR